MIETKIHENDIKNTYSTKKLGMFFMFVDYKEEHSKDLG